MDNNNKPQTKFPQKQTKLNQAENDYLIDNIPNDFSNLMGNTSDPDINRIYDKFKKRTIYIYEIERLFKNNENNTLKFSPNTIKIGFIDIEKVLNTNAVETSDFNMQLNQRASTNINDNAIEYSMTDIKNLIFQEIDLLNQFKLYAVSINETLTESNIDNLYIINSYSQPYQNPKTRSTKSITIIKIKDFKTRDGYPIIIKLQKPLDKDTKVKSITLKFPKTMLFGNIKVNGEINGLKVSPNLLIADDNQLFPLYALPIQTQPKVNILQQWFSDQVLSWDIAKNFMNQNSILDYLDIGEILPNQPSQEFKHVKKIELKEVKAVATSYFKETGYDINKNFDNILISKDDNSSYLSGYWNDNIQQYDLSEKKYYSYVGEVKSGTWKLTSVDSVVLTYDKVKPITTLGKLLMDMLGYTYNYQANFKGYDPKYDANPDVKQMPDITNLRNEFENQKPHDVITNLFEQWKLDNPDFINNPKVKIFKQVVMMLSNYILSYLSINKGLDDDYKLLLPYYFELKSKPTRSSNHDRWNFDNVYVVLKSEYFDFTDPNNIKVKNKNISQNEWFKLSNNQYNWLSLTNELESNNIPSLLPQDMSLNNGEYGKYMIKGIINNVLELLKCFNSEKQYFSNWDWFNFIQNNIFANQVKFSIEKEISNLHKLEISGIFGNGNYDILLETESKTINIDNIALFDTNDETLSYINIEI
ncbi:hypothetical protein [Spiroplasma endosymbiont of Virgichneumon dumeticola]|uniref:hypothetical protein n=1 Tax=Spiroplasma endosymbiont of Virgichneumon dumeticola TaxID=3139323 RepID=UPI0035C8B904